MYKLLTSKEISNITKHIPREIIIYKKVKRERFKQVIYNNEPLPYIISDTGRLFSINQNNTKKGIHQIKLSVRKDGYLQARITYNSKRRSYLVHRLVAEAFIKNNNPKKNIVVNHKDGDKAHNVYTNLEWTTYSKNTLHALHIGLTKHARGESVSSSKYKTKDIIKVCELITSNTPISVISAKTGVGHSAIFNILHKRAWKHVSDGYDFSNYLHGKNPEYFHRVHLLCKLAKEEKYTIHELHKMTGINKRTIYDILKGKTNKHISSQYNLKYL